jgi:hypothetical protein
LWIETLVIGAVGSSIANAIQSAISSAAGDQQCSRQSAVKSAIAGLPNTIRNPQFAIRNDKEHE